jgi:hypothetical protein
MSTTMQDPAVQANGAGSEQARPPQVSSVRLVATLAIAGALAGMLIVTVFQWAQPRMRCCRGRSGPRRCSCGMAH